jgi:hypothetical protein
MRTEYGKISVTRCGSYAQNQQTSSRASTSLAIGDPLGCGAAVGVVALQGNNQARSANTRRQPRGHRSGPQGFLSAAQVAVRADAALSSVYHWINTGRLGKPHRWRNLLVVPEQAADEFLVTVKPVQAASGEEGAP